MDPLYLLEVQFPSEHRDIGIRRVEPERLGVRDVHLGREMHFHPGFLRVAEHRGVRRDNRGNAGRFRGVHDPPHFVEFLVVHDRVHGEVALDALLAAELRDLPEILNREGVRGVRPHVELSDPEVHSVSPGLERRVERLAGTDRSHDFKVRAEHER